MRSSTVRISLHTSAGSVASPAPAAATAANKRSGATHYTTTAKKWVCTIDHGCDGGRGALWDGWGTKCARVNRPQRGKALDEAKPCVQRVQLPACSRCHAQLASISDSSDRNEESSVNIWLYRPYDTPELTMAGRYDTSASAPTLLSSAIAFL